MRRLSLVGILLLLLLAACGGEDESPDNAGSSTPANLPDTGTPSPDATAPVAGDHELGLTVGTSDLEFLLHAPPAVDQGDPLPLVVVFHGTTGEMVEATGFNQVADEEGFLVAYPRSFSTATEVTAMLDHLAEQWPVDPERVYATGFSRGAAATYLLAGELGERFAAYAPVSGFQPGAGPSEPASLITFQGTEDQLASAWPGVNRDWARAAGCGAAETEEINFAGRPTTRSVASCRGGTEHVVYRVEGMGHVWPRPATKVIWAFFAGVSAGR